MGCAPRGSHPSGSRPRRRRSEVSAVPSQPGRFVRRAGAIGVAGATAAVGYRLLVQGGLTVDTGWGRTVRPLGPIALDIAAPPDLVFATCSQSHISGGRRGPWPASSRWSSAGRTWSSPPTTPIRRGLVATTLETVRFQRPHRIDFRLVAARPVRGRAFPADPGSGRHSLEYGGELGADFWLVGRWWGDRVATKWAVVRATFDTVKAEAERRVTRR